MFKSIPKKEKQSLSDGNGRITPPSGYAWDSNETK
jgi:hypothetical protein